MRNAELERPRAAPAASIAPPGPAAARARTARRSMLRALAAPAALALLVALAAAPQLAHAQARSFPPGTRVGTLAMGVFPLAQIDGKDVRFSPGGRIYDTRNAVAIPSTVVAPVRVRYALDTMGQVNRAWILTEEEARAAGSQPVTEPEVPGSNQSAPLMTPAKPSPGQ